MKTTINKVLPLAAIGGLFLAGSTQAATYLGTGIYTGYSGQTTSANDSPFFSTFGAISLQDPNGETGEVDTTGRHDFRGLTSTVAVAGSTYFFLEDVQDGQLDTPGVDYIGSGVIARTNGGINGSNNGTSNTDNVAEDSIINSSFRSTTSPRIRANFSAAALGGELPTYVGIVFAENTNAGTRTITAYDSDDNVLETLSQASGSQLADQFLGLSTDTGISYVIINGDQEFDHFQYGFAAAPVPEPSSTALLGLGGLALILRRRRK